MDKIKTFAAILFLLSCTTGVAQESGSAMSTDAGDMGNVLSHAVTRGRTE